MPSSSATGRSRPGEPDTPELSVVIPTLGRRALLRRCLASLAACDPQPREVLVVHQGDGSLAGTLGEFSGLTLRTVTCGGRGAGSAMNLGIREARCDFLIRTDDDCTVATDWIGTASRHLAAHPEAIITGRVLPSGDPRAVPSTIQATAPRRYTGKRHFHAVYGNNMAAQKALILGVGGFDERLVPAAEDVDLGYRWLRCGLEVRYEPDLVVWHHDWRTRDELAKLYEDYARGRGLFYAKHLRGGDPRMLVRLAKELWKGAQASSVRRARRGEEWPRPDDGVLRGLPGGLREGWRRFRG